MATQFTEESHPASVAVDTATPEALAALMINETDIFTGWKGTQGVLGDDVLATIIKIQEKVADILQDCENNAIVVAGCGTSGRFAFMTARAVNNRLRKLGKRPCVIYLMAGHDMALFKSQEGFEDNPLLGQKELEKAVADRKHVIYMGITCGLSAPFVAGQLDLCLRHLDRFTPVLLGFNKVHMARNLSIENWDKTFLEVAEKMEREQKEERAFILNPIVGPELITGSTRMKAGTATKILLDVIFAPRQERAPPAQPRASARQSLAAYHSALYAVHQDGNDAIFGRIITMAAFSLQNGGHVFYLGATHLGLVGLIDASECPPTYGASLDDFRGFIDGGYSCLQNEEGDMSDQVEIGIEYFTKTKLPEATASDLVVVLAREGDVSFAPDVTGFRCRAVVVNVHTDPKKTLPPAIAAHFVDVLDVDLAGCLCGVVSSSRTWMETSLSETAAKWVCNIISTGAHVLNGKVYGNLMIDVNVSNNKLFHRAIRTITPTTIRGLYLGKTRVIHHLYQTLVRCSWDAAHHLLLRAIYMSDEVTEETSQQPISAHLEVAASRRKIVPLALVIGMRGCTVAEADRHLRQFPVVRRAIAEHRK